MNAQQQNLIRRVAALRCLPQFQKQFVAAKIAQIDDAAALQNYDQYGLSFVERTIEPLAHGDAARSGSPPFARLSEHFADCADPAELATALGVPTPPEFEPAIWFEWAAALQMTPVPCLYCLGNFWILPIFDHRNPQFIAMTLPSVVQCVRYLGQRELAVHAAESWLGLAEADYASVASLSAALDAAWQRKQLFDGNNQSGLVSTLADALRFVPGREDRHAARLSEAWLGLGTRVPEYKSATKFQGSTGYMRLGFVQSWLRAAGAEHEEALTTCRAVVADVRDHGFLAPQQRQDFLKNIRGIWGDLQATGLARSAAARERSDDAEADRLEQEVLVWGEAFENRSLVEDMLEHYRRVGRDGAAIIAGWNAEAWPWTEIWTREKVQPAWLANWQRFRSGDGGTGDPFSPDPFAYPKALALPLEGRDAVAAYEVTEPANLRPLTPEEQQLREELSQVAAREIVLEKLVPVGALWVRMLFDDRDGSAVTGTRPVVDRAAGVAGVWAGRRRSDGAKTGR